MNDIIITTYPHEYGDTFKYYIVDKNTILVERIDKKAGWWLNLVCEIVNIRTNEKILINMGRNTAFYYKMVSLDFDLYREDISDLEEQDENIPDDTLILKNGLIFDSTTIKEEDIELNSGDIIITISSIIYITQNKIEGSDTRSSISIDERYRQTLYSLKKFMQCVPNSKIILLEQSQDIPEEKIAELLKYCDYIITYKNDSDNNYYSNIQSLNKGLGELYVTQHFCELIKNKKFNTFCKVVGRYTPTSKFNINDFITGEPTVKAIKGEGRLGIICFTNFFSIPHKYFKAYLEHHKIWLSKDRTEPVEHILTMFIESLPRIKLLPMLHIKGRRGMTNEYCYL